MPAFHDVRFPTDISYGSVGGPEFSTEVVELGSGREQRNINWAYSRERWNVAYGIKRIEQLNELLRFFYARRGRAHGFRFKNHNDYQAGVQELGTGDSSQDEFQLVNNYDDLGGGFTRKITKPIADSVQVFIDGVEQIDSSGDPVGWSIDNETGIITFDASVLPASGEVVSASFDFDIPMRFDTDYLPVTLETYLAGSANVPLVELFL